jgi:hypothetical protein
MRCQRRDQHQQRQQQYSGPFENFFHQQRPRKRWASLALELAGFGGELSVCNVNITKPGCTCRV